MSTHQQPHKQLGQLMKRAQARGLSFDDFWREAVRPRMRPVILTNMEDPPVGAIRWPTDHNDRKTWQSAIWESRDGWRRVYEGWPPARAEKALASLSETLEALRAAA